MRSEGVEPIYGAGTESGLMDIYNFPGNIYATDGSKGSTGMGAGFYRHDTKGGGCCRVGGGVAGSGSSGRAEFAAACLALEDSITHDHPIAVLTDSKGLMTVASKWVGEGKDPLLQRRCTRQYHQGSPPKGEYGPLHHVYQNQITSQRKGRQMGRRRWRGYRQCTVGWDGPSLQPTFSWIEEGVELRCSMNKTLRTRVHLKISEHQLPLHKNYTSEYLNREDNSRNLLGKHWQDKTVPDRSKRCLLQSIGHQFPCAKLLQRWGLRDSDECRLCKRLHPEVMPWPESLGHIQARCPALQKPRIAVHHGIWRELLTAISMNSEEFHDYGNRKWYFPSAVSEATHDEWTVRQILVHPGLFSGIKSLRADVTDFHARQNIVLTDGEITSFYSRRHD